MNGAARNAVVFPPIVALAAFLAGCAVMDTGAFTRLQDEMVGLKKEVAVLKAAPPPASRRCTSRTGRRRSRVRCWRIATSRPVPRMQLDSLGGIWLKNA